MVAAEVQRPWPPYAAGRLYGGHTVHALFRRFSVYHGSGGFAPFQSLYECSTSFWGSLPLMPEWYLLIALLALVSTLEFTWKPLWVAIPLLLVAVALTVVHAIKEASGVSMPETRGHFGRLLRVRATVAALHILQPMARLWGRLDGGLTAWRPLVHGPFTRPWPVSSAEWTSDWREPQRRLEDVITRLTRQQVISARGGAYDRWDIEVFGGALGSARLLMAIEDHGAGTQYVRTRCWPRLRPIGAAMLLLFGGATAASSVGAPWFVPALFAGFFVAGLTQTVRQCGCAMGVLRAATGRPPPQTRAHSRPVTAPALDESVAVK
jgi:O-antigen biosynthesis protein